MIKKKKLNPAAQIAIGFFAVIFIGTFLLCLPWASKSGEWFSFVDSFLTSTSAVCVTGLTVVDLVVHFSLFGQIVILLLIQIGGLGFITLTSLIFLIIGKKITFENRLTLKESLNQDSVQGVVKLVKKIIVFVFSTELVGAILLAPSFISVYGWGRGVFNSIFISISSFCNAGFDILGNGKTSFLSLANFSQNAFVLIPIMLLIVLGGIGFLVIFELPNVFKKQKISTNSKIVLIVTSVLIFSGAVLFALLEWNNAQTIGNMSVGGKILNSFFFSVTPRTAGFATISYSSLSPASLALTQFLMFIGGSPASTAGGIKTTTLFVLLLVLFKNTNLKGDLVFRKKKVPNKLIQKCLRVLCLALVLVCASTFLICAIDGLPFFAVLFETISAISTVGLTLGITPVLSVISKTLISFLMFIGRVGAVTLTLALGSIEDSIANEIDYPDSKLIVG